MKEKVDIGVVALINFMGDFRDRFGIMLKTRGYFVSGDDEKDPYFERNNCYYFKMLLKN